MGPITGFRIVNLRVHDGDLDKVAYPDLTINIGTGDHVVIGLENGGGKGTMLGFLLHVFLPDARLFLPRLAQRRQHRQGEEKRIEQYVPGGRLPTHVVIELELPAVEARRPGQPSRVLAGACLYKPSGGGSSEPAKEFFWSARCVTAELTLADLGLRGENGRLLDHREWRSRLDTLRIQRPDAEIMITDGDANWGNHLRSTLKVDVEFVKSWLLAMNEDEGAADHVFTYGSSRAFLDTLVKAIAPPELIADVNQNLIAMAADADNMKIDRRREALLRRLVEHTGPLAEHMEHLNAHDRVRGQLVDSLVITLTHMQLRRTAMRGELDDARSRENAASVSASDANAAQMKSFALELLARLQVAELEHAGAHGRVKLQTRLAAESEAASKACSAAATLCVARTLGQRISDTARLLAEKALDAEPQRLAAASAAQAWLARVKAEIEAVGDKQKAADDEAEAAQGDEDRHGQQLINAESALSRLQATINSTTREIERIDGLIAAARQREDLAAEQSVTAAAAHWAGQVTALEEQAADALKKCKSWQEQLDQLIAQIAKFEIHAAGVDAELMSARTALDQLLTATGNLESALTECGLLDLEAIHLDDHVELIDSALAAVADSAGVRQLQAGVQAAVAQRAVHSLETSGLLPARTDVSALCDRGARLGARPGWTYLAQLPPGTARRYAEAMPELADGIVVNVPDDFADMVQLVSDHRADLQGPVTIGSPSAFEGSSGGDVLTVILPDEAFWSREAGIREVSRRREAFARHQADTDDETARYRTALTLRERIRQWQTEIGTGARSVAEERVRIAQEAAEAIPGERERLQDRQQNLIKERDAAGTAEQELRQELDRARSRQERLTILVGQVAPHKELQQRITDLEADASEQETASKTARKAMHTARQCRDQALRIGAGHGRTIAELNVIEADAKSANALVTKTDDPVRAEDAQADRAILAERARMLTDRWRGLTSDNALQGELDLMGQQLKETESKLKRDHGHEAIATARALMDQDPSRIQVDFEQDASQAQARSLALNRELGGLEETEKRLAQHLSGLAKDVQQLKRGTQLPSQYVTTDLGHAEHVHRQLADDLSKATDSRQQANELYDAAKDKAQLLSDWIDLSETASSRLDILVSGLAMAAAGRLTSRIDVHDREFELKGILLSEDSPDAFREVLGAFAHADQPPAAAAKEHIKRLLDTIAADIDHLQGLLDDANRLVIAELDQVRRALLSAGDEIVAGDKLIQVMRDLAESDLAAAAGRYHGDASQRLAAVAHHVARFDDRLQRLAQETFATVQHLVRSVKQTVSASQLPFTPAMGRWAGIPLLKISGLDWLDRQQREDAILTTLRHWFDPDGGTTRPRFDANHAISALVEAVTPRAAASVLIPSDPLDPAHKPVESLAITSGGEGVTVALILASLLAARRARNLGHRRTTLLLDNPFAKVNKPMFLRLARDVARSLGVQLVPLTGIRDLGALTVFPSLIQLRVSRRATANAVVPVGMDDDRIQQLVRDGTLYVSPVELQAAAADAEGDRAAWPVMSRAEVHWQEPLDLGPLDDQVTAANGKSSVQ